MVRSAHRTRLARVFAIWLLLLAVSPLTAPFTTCDLSDFVQSHPVDTSHHPGRQMAEAHVKALAHVLTIAPTPVASLALRTSDYHAVAAQIDAVGYVRQDLRSVLRL